MTVVIGAVAVTVKQRQAAGHGAFRPGMLEITAQGQQGIGSQIRFQDAIQGLPLLLISVLPVLPVLIGQHHPATDAGILIEPPERSTTPRSMSQEPLLRLTLP